MSEAYLAFAFTLGIASFFTPCAVGMVPAYLGYFLRQDESKKASRGRRIGDGLLFGLITTLGFVSIFGLAGLGLYALGPEVRGWVGPNLFLLAFAVAAVLIVMGAATLANKTLPFTIP